MLNYEITSWITIKLKPRATPWTTPQVNSSKLPTHSTTCRSHCQREELQKLSVEVERWKKRERFVDEQRARLEALHLKLADRKQRLATTVSVSQHRLSLMNLLFQSTSAQVLTRLQNSSSIINIVLQLGQQEAWRHWKHPGEPIVWSALQRFLRI